MIPSHQEITDTSTVLNANGTVAAGNGNGTSMSIGTGSARCDIEMTDVSSGHRGMPKVANNMHAAVDVIDGNHQYTSKRL